MLPPLAVFEDLDDVDAFMGAVESSPNAPEPALDRVRRDALAALRASGVDIPPDDDFPSLIAQTLSLIQRGTRELRAGEFFPTLRLNVAQAALAELAIRCCHRGPLARDAVASLRLAAMNACGWRAQIEVARRDAEIIRLVEISNEGIAKRKKLAAEERRKMDAAIAPLQREANRLRETYPSWFNKNITAELLKVPGVRKHALRQVKIPRRRKSVR